MTALKTIIPPRWMAGRKTRRLISVLSSDAGSARFVGGCVRDAIIQKPAKDIDIAVTHPPERVMGLLKKNKIRAIATGIDHGTVTAVMNGQHYEITTLRRDVKTDGRHAEVAFTDDWQADAERRDFTMNAIYCAVDGTLYDPVSGIDDLLAGRVRFIGDAGQRITEDYLRILRLFRFYAYYGKTSLDPGDLAACQKHVEGIATLSAERIRDEFFKILAAPNPAAIIDLMRTYGVMESVWAGAQKFSLLQNMVAASPQSDAMQRLMAVMMENNCAPENVAARFRLSTAQLRRIESAMNCARGGAPKNNSDDLHKIIYFHGAESARDAALLWLAAQMITRDHAEAIVNAAGSWRRHEFPLTGHDVMAIGVTPGPKIGQLLAEVESWWVDAGFPADRAACLARLGEIAKQ